MKNMLYEIMTVFDLALFLGCSSDSIYTLLKQHEMPACADRRCERSVIYQAWRKLTPSNRTRPSP